MAIRQVSSEENSNILIASVDLDTEKAFQAIDLKEKPCERHVSNMELIFFA